MVREYCAVANQIPIPYLISGVDVSYIFRQQLSNFLTTEFENQYALAQAAGITGSDLTAYNPVIYSENFRIKEDFLNINDEDVNLTRPVINIWFQNVSYEKTKGGYLNVQSAISNVNIDIYCCRSYSETLNIPGDQYASIFNDVVTSITRKILMSEQYNQLGLEDSQIVGNGVPNVNNISPTRWVESIDKFQEEIGNNQTHNIVASRIRFCMKGQETSPMYQPLGVLDYISAAILDSNTDKILIQGDFEG